METPAVHRPRNVDWVRAASLLYGDWGTSKAYVIGLAFLGPVAASGLRLTEVAGFHALPVILAVSALTALVASNYIIVCKHFPDGGGVYSAAREQSRTLAAMGALLLVANFTVTAAMSGWAAMSYFGVPKAQVALVTVLAILGIGLMNHFGPKHTGSVAISLAAPMVVVVVLIVGWSLPHLTTANLGGTRPTFGSLWVGFTWAILALSGVEAIASLTGVMKLDPGATLEKPAVRRTSRRAILLVAFEVVLGTSLLGWAMLSLPRELEPQMLRRWEDMLRFLGEQYGLLAYGPGFGKWFGLAVGLVVGLLLLSAVNTAIAALIGLFYMMARDGEMPTPFTRLNVHGVPRWPLIVAVGLPALTVILAPNLESLAGLYAIGVVGAIAVNLGSCSFNRKLALNWRERGVMGLSFLILLAVELTIAKTRPDALFFATCVLGAGFALRAYAQKRAGWQTLTLPKEVAAAVAPDLAPEFRPNLQPGQSILVAARGLTPVLRYALEEARLREATLYVLFVRELAVTLPGPLSVPEPARWQDNLQASRIMSTVLELGRTNQVTVVPLYAVSENPASAIVDMAATLGADILMLGASQRQAMVRLLKGNVIAAVARNLPENIQLVIHG